jgi:hypothetical protein
VTSIDIVYPNGHITHAVVDNGYFLGWVLPTSGASTGRTDFSPPVTVVARNSAGKEEVEQLACAGVLGVPLLDGRLAEDDVH